MEWNQKCGLNGKRNACVGKKENGKNGANVTSNPFYSVTVFLNFQIEYFVKG
jgi:hypothetical protein